MGRGQLLHAELASGSSFALVNAALRLNTLTLGGATLFLDPAFLGVYALASDLNAQVYAGDGSVLSLGGIDGLRTVVSDAGLHVRSANTGFTSDGYTVTTTRRNIRRTFPDIIAASSINSMSADGINDVNSPEAGVRFLSRASVTANVQHTAFRAIEAAEDAIEQQLSFASLNAKVFQSAKTAGMSGQLLCTPILTRTTWRPATI